MVRKIKILYTAIILLLVMPANSMPVNDSLRFEILMSSRMLKSAKIQADFISSVDVTSGHHVLLSSKNQFYLLGWGGMKPLGKTSSSGVIRSFAFSPDSLLMVIRNDEVCFFDSKGTLEKLYKLPDKEMGICAGKNVMYVFDQGNSRPNKAIYVLSRGGKYAVLLESATPINAMAELDNTIYFASGNMVCRYDMKTKDHKVVATLSKEKAILSLTADPENKRIYFSTRNSIYAVNESNAITLSGNIGGFLKFYGGGLVVFDPGNKFLLRITEIEEVLKNAISGKQTATGTTQATPKATSETKILNNSSIIDMVKSGMSDVMIISVIRQTKADFNLTVDAMVELSGKGVSSEVISEMRQAMKRQASQTQTK